MSTQEGGGSDTPMAFVTTSCNKNCRSGLNGGQLVRRRPR